MIRFALALLLMGCAHPALARAPKDYFIEVELIAETARPKPGEAVLVGLRMVPKPGWHSYWTNPGQAGLPTLVDWTAPAGVSFEPLRHPPPTLVQVGGVTSFVHEGPHVLLSRVTIDRDTEAGTPIPVTAKVSWGACSDKACVPERATLSLQLTTGDGAPSPHAGLLQRALARVPGRIDGGTFEVEDGRLLVQLPADVSLDARRARFFPDENDLVDAAGARVVAARPLRIAAPTIGPAPETLTGVVSDGSSAYRLSFDRAALEVSGPARAEVAPTEAAADRPPVQAAAAAELGRSVEAVSARQHVDQAAVAGESRILATAGAGVLAGLALLALVFFRRGRPKRS